MKTVRRRYFAVKIDSIEEVEERELKNAVWKTIERLFGEYGASRASFVLINYDAAENYAVFRCAHQAIEPFKASLASITEINGKPAAVHILGVSGTLKTLRMKFLSK